ncbi:MAG: hypothetical protein M1833_002355 [Piccolia ochrophora]|nr:MAG: hypothetical protein M1833_002355 [Piccolia ochrophora]
MENGAGSKRKAEAETSAVKKGKTSAGKEQKSLEDTMLGVDKGEPAEVESNQADNVEDGDGVPKEETNGSDAKDEEPNLEGDAVEEDKDREESVPSAILEKGIIYLFFRGRVGITEPQGVQDIARTYMILRPLPHGAKLGDGPIGDDGNTRLLALPKKVLPVSHRDRFMTFVEKGQTTMKDLKENFIAGSDYETRTAGARHAPSATPAGEGVYAITTTGRESHLAYILTRPSDLGEVQEEIGLRQRGSFVLSAKNPEVGGPSYANLPEGAKYSKDIQDDFRGRGWMPLQARMLDYDNTQLLLIGEGQDEMKKAVEEQPKDQKQDKAAPLEEMEKLEEEDDERVNHLKEDDPVFVDLDLDSKEHSTLQSTW